MRQRIELDTGWAEWSGPYVRVGDRAIPERIDVTMPGPAGGELPGLRMTIEAIGGAPRCTELVIYAQPGGREVRSTDLRAVRLEQWVEDIATWTSGDVIQTDDGAAQVVLRVGAIDAERERKVLRELQRARSKSRRTVTDEVLRVAAETYRANASSRPVEAVGRAFATSHRTAARYVALARERGYLPPTTPGKVTV